MDTERFFEFNLSKIFQFILSVLKLDIIISVIFIPIIIAGLGYYFLPLPGKIIAIIIILLFITMKYHRIEKSRFGYSNKRIFISIWNWGKRTTNIIDYSDIGKITIELYPNGGGIIHFLPNKPLAFGGKALLSGFNRHYPTIEFVFDIKNVAEDIRRQKKEAMIKKSK